MRHKLALQRAAGNASDKLALEGDIDHKGWNGDHYSIDIKEAEGAHIADLVGVRLWSIKLLNH